MSTTARIGILNEDGTVLSSYIHCDGYPSEVGKVLLEHYNAEDKLRHLLSYGDMSNLESTIGEKHDFNNPPDNQCTFYGRDRGEDPVNVDAFLYQSERVYWLEARKYVDYAYLSKNGQWYMDGGELLTSAMLREKY